MNDKRIKELEARLQDLDSRNNYQEYAGEIKLIEAELHQHYQAMPDWDTVPF